MEPSFEHIVHLVEASAAQKDPIMQKQVGNRSRSELLWRDERDL